LGFGLGAATFKAPNGSARPASFPGQLRPQRFLLPAAPPDFAQPDRIWLAKYQQSGRCRQA
jgi:hypothetical protein